MPHFRPGRGSPRRSLSFGLNVTLDGKQYLLPLGTNLDPDRPRPRFSSLLSVSDRDERQLPERGNQRFIGNRGVAVQRDPDQGEPANCDDPEQPLEIAATGSTRRRKETSMLTKWDSSAKKPFGFREAHVFVKPSGDPV